MNSISDAQPARTSADVIQKMTGRRDVMWSAVLTGLCLASACGSPGDSGRSFSEDDDEGTACSSFFDCEVGQQCSPDGVCLDSDDPALCQDEDGDGYGEGCEAGPDCDDSDLSRNPGKLDLCDGRDEDCDLLIDEGDVCQTCVDECEVGQRECLSDASFRVCALDELGCARWQPLVFCDVLCEDGRCVEGCLDNDNDGFGVGCEAGPDCDDRNAQRFPGNPERCDGFDNDCNAQVDEGGVCDDRCEPECEVGEQRCQGGSAVQFCALDAEGCPQWSVAQRCGDGTSCEGGQCVGVEVCDDADDDGYGPGCSLGPDCAPNDPDINPGAAEICDAIDNDCDGRIDDGTPNSCPQQRCAAQQLNNPRQAPALQAQVSGTAYTCPGQPSYWRVAGGRNFQSIQLAASRDDSLSDLRVELLDPDLNVVDERQGAGVAAIFDTPRVDNYFLRVTATGDSPEPYAIGWDNATDLRCNEGPEEPNNSPFSPSPSLWAGQIKFGTLCRGDLDFYSLPIIESGQILSIEMAPVTDGQRMLVEVWHDGRRVTPDQTRPGGALHVHMRFDQPGAYAVAVRGLTPLQGRYVLGASVTTSACPQEDAREDDDTIGEARGFNGDSFSGAICPGDLDFIDLGNLSVDDQVRLSVRLGNLGGNLDAYLLREGIEGLLQVALTDNPTEILPTRIPRAGRYYVLIQGRDAVDLNTYTFQR